MTTTNVFARSTELKYVFTLWFLSMGHRGDGLVIFMLLWSVVGGKCFPGSVVPIALKISSSRRKRSWNRRLIRMINSSLMRFSALC